MKMTCVKCKTDKGMSTSRLVKLTKDIDAEHLRKTYLCRSCRGRGKKVVPDKNIN